MQNTIQKFRQSSIVFEKRGIFSENLKTLTSSNYPTIQYFLLKLCTRFLHTNVYKRVCVIFFYFVQILSYLQKLKTTWFLDTRFSHFYRPGFYTLVFYTQDLNKIKKSRTRVCRHYLVENVCRISAKNIELYGRWSSSKFSIFLLKNLVSWK